MDVLVDRFKCQYYQLVPARSFQLARIEEIHLLVHDEFQKTIERILFPGGDSPLQVPESYRRSIVKLLLREFDALQVEVSESLIEYYASSTHDTPSTRPIIVGPKDQVGVVAPPSTMPEQAVTVRYFYKPDESFIVTESPAVLVAHGTTGHKTWEAALALGDYLLADPSIIKSRSVLELGAGTGFLSLLSSRLGASKVTATDGSDKMVQLMQANVSINHQQDEIDCSNLWFGKDNQLERNHYDVILGADVTYDESVLDSLCKTIKNLLTSNPAATVLIAATVRREKT